MSQANAGWLYYKYPFLNNSKNIKEANTKLLKSKHQTYPYPKGTHHATTLKVIYPGLVVGSGYMHSIKGETENFDFGFFFDHTTGMPVIPGSSIKGVLRSYFRMLSLPKLKQNNDSYIYPKRDMAIAMLGDMLTQIGASDMANLESIVQIEKEIFDGIDSGGDHIPMALRDKFYDAFIVSGSEGGQIFADDSITPHKEPLKEPVPNRMLKVRSGVQFGFGFDLHDGVLTVAQKEQLFFLLLQFGGVGAKTNVGYGQFEESELSKFKTHQLTSQKLDEMSKESPATKIINEFKTTADIVSAYEQGLKERVSSFKDELKRELLRHLNKELSLAKPKKQEKIKNRVLRVEGW